MLLANHIFGLMLQMLPMVDVVLVFFLFFSKTSAIKQLKLLTNSLFFHFLPCQYLNFIYFF